MIKVVNMIPASLSSEANQDAEPNLSVNPANPMQIAATAFTGDTSHPGKAPIYISTDGGDTWQINSIVPHGNTSIGTGDITIRFATTGNTLYAGDLRGDDSSQMDVLRTATMSGTTMSALPAEKPQPSIFHLTPRVPPKTSSGYGSKREARSGRIIIKSGLRFTLLE